MIKYLKNKLERISFVHWCHINTEFLDLSFRKFFKDIFSYSRFRKEFISFSKNKRDDFLFSWQDIFPCLEDKSSEIDFEPHYTYHPAWAARILAKIKPEKHIDISSTRYFALLVSAFISVEYYEYRPLSVNLSGLECKSADITKLPFADNSVYSLSCMHVLEHIGLGRYGDPLDCNGDLIAAAELSRVVQHNGHFLLVVPMSDPPKIQFNAHRMYSYRQILNMFSDFELESFSFVRGKDYIENAHESDTTGCMFACGCFYFRRK